MKIKIASTTRSSILIGLTVVLVAAIVYYGNLLRLDFAHSAYKQGMVLQKERKTEAAIISYSQAILLNSSHAESYYELGWSYWVLERWDQVIQAWEQALALNIKNKMLIGYLKQARDNQSGKLAKLVRAPIGTRAEQTTLLPEQTTRLALELTARFQEYNPKTKHPADVFDHEVLSPKSVQFHPSENKIYVNALEGYKTIIYDYQNFKKLGQIEHRFGEKDSHLFEKQNKSNKHWLDFPRSLKKNPQHFSGKPVESAFSADGHYLWVPYYRRSFDRYSSLPSAVALIDATTDKIIRLFDTGPIPKYVTSSPDGKWLAVTHWGDNTVGFIKTTGEPNNYEYSKLVAVGERIQMSEIETQDRDHNCGNCLRGSVFSKDNKYLFVARMGGGGVAIIDVKKGKHLGTVRGMQPTPRHIVLSPDGEHLYISSNFSGVVSKYRANDMINAAKKHQKKLKPLLEVNTGKATRTIALSPDGETIYAAVNKESKIAVLDAKTLTYLFDIAADSYPVGMDVSPDGTQLWVTSQGRKARGGNSVMVYTIEKKPIDPNSSRMAFETTAYAN